MRIAQVSVNVDDPVKAHQYYTEVLGFVSKAFQPEHLLAIVVSPEDPGGTELLLEPSDHPLVIPFRRGIYNEGLPAIVFSVPDLQAEYERLTARGVHFRSAPTRNDWGFTAMFDDTCGNVILLTQAA